MTKMKPAKLFRKKLVYNLNYQINKLRKEGKI